MPMSLMQRYDWADVKALLVYSVPEYSNTHEDNVSGIAMLNRIVKDRMESKIPDSLITIEYQVTIVVFVYLIIF